MQEGGLRLPGASSRFWDFAQTVAGTTAQCSAQTVDGHDPPCLLGGRAQKRGAISSLMSAASAPRVSLVCTNFSRPPVEVVLSFPHEIEIHSIVLHPRVRAHCVEVLSLEVAPGDGEFKYLGTYSGLNDLSAQGQLIQLWNPRISRNGEGIPLPARTWAGKIERSAFSLSKVKRLKIIIKKALHSTCVVLGLLEVWARPASSCRKAEADATIMRLTQADASILDPKSGQQPASDSSPFSQRLSVFGSERNEDMRQSILHQSPASAWDELHVMAEKIPNEIVPSHFLDPITYTLMLTPVMLPSGQVVDSNTILLHMQNHLTDPFSGLPLHENQLIPDLALQAEIEQFIRRCTAARSRNPPQRPPGHEGGGKVRPRHVEGQPRREDAELLRGLKRKSYEQRGATGPLDSKRRREVIVLDDDDEWGGSKEKEKERDEEEEGSLIDKRAKRKKKHKKSKKKDKHRKRRRMNDSSSSESEEGEEYEIHEDEENEKESENAIGSRFTVLKGPDNHEVILLDDDQEGDEEGRPREGMGCVFCGQEEAQVALELPCSHLGCRECVVKLSKEDYKCPTCHQPFQRGQLQRKHLQ